MSKTTAEQAELSPGAKRQAVFVARKKAEGLTRMNHLWAHPDDHRAIRAYAQQLAEQRAISVIG